MAWERLWGESTGHRWIPSQKVSNAEIVYILWLSPEKAV